MPGAEFVSKRAPRGSGRRCPPVASAR